MNIRFAFIILTIGVFVGVLLAWQSSNEDSLTNVFPTDAIEAKDELLKNFLDEQSYLQSRIVYLRKDIEEAQDKVKTKSATANFDLLENLKKTIGLTEVSGEGLEITLDDSPLAKRDGDAISDSTIIQASDLRDIVNVLNAAKSDAISINNQRVIATTPISSVGTTILVNNSHISPPFVINAVGDSEIMLQRLLNKNLLPAFYEKVQKSGVKFSVLKRAKIVIGIYNGDLKTNYLNLVNQ